MPGVIALLLPHTRIHMQREIGLFSALLLQDFFLIVKKQSQQNESSTIVYYVWHSLLVVCQALIEWICSHTVVTFIGIQQRR